MAGRFWSELGDDYVIADVQPAVAEGRYVVGPVPPVRSQFFSKHTDYLVQVQPDRFYTNWRRVSSDGCSYPHFEDRGADKEGVLGRATKGFRLFSDFCRVRLEHSPRVQQVELAKVNLLVQGTHWEELSELGELLPAVAPTLAMYESGSNEVQIQTSGMAGNNSVTVSMDLVDVVPSVVFPNKAKALKLELRGRAPASAHNETTFKEVNENLNLLFQRLIPLEQRNLRFGIEEAV